MTSQRGYDRLINLSDAVVAIAATLLVLPLVDLADELQHESLGALLGDNVGKLLAFVLSFLVICQFWRAHHRTYLDVERFRPALVWVNFLWLLSIVFLPFPTEMIASPYSDGRASDALYIGTMVVTSLAGLAQKALIVSTPELQVEDVRGTLTVGPTLVATGAMAVALLLALLVPHVGLYALLVLIPAGLVERRIQRRDADRVTAGRSGPPTG